MADKTRLPPRELWGGLLVPTRYFEGSRRRASAPDPSFMLISLGYRAIFGNEATWDGVIERLKRYKLGQVLKMVGHLSVVIDRLEPWRDVRPQLRIADQLLGSRSSLVRRKVAEALERERSDRSASMVSLFDELQLLNLTKAAFLVLPVDDGCGEAETFEPLGEALLMITDLIEGAPWRVQDVDHHTPEGERAWDHYLLVNSLFHRGDLPLHAMARAYDLYLRDRPHLLTCPSYLDLPTVIRQVTGLTPEVVWASLFAPRWTPKTGH